ncbi:tetratricopeptide repeat protein, partial [Rhodovulum imhoffii]
PERPDPKHVEMLERLRAIVAERPQDQRGFELLARNEAALGHFARAHAAQARVIALKGDEATAMDYATLADMMVLAAGGYVSPEAEGALSNALNRNPNNGTALYYWGLMHAQTGRPDVTFRVWRQLLQNSGPDDPWVRPIRGQIEDLALRAGVNYTLPPEPTLRGPSAADIENAGDMTPEQRQQMIAGMVASLSDRLATQGGTPQEWAQLIRALGTLNDTARANGIWMEAQQVFSASPEAMETLRNAARAAGLLE